MSDFWKFFTGVSIAVVVYAVSYVGIKLVGGNIFLAGLLAGGFAAVAFYGSTDLIHSYRMKSGSSMPVHGDVVAGDRGGPDMAPEHWKGRSIFYNLDKVKTPLQVQWGDRDGVRISMADDLFREAKKQGLYMEYIQYIQ